VQLNASIIKPPDFNPQKKYPVLVYTYGAARSSGPQRLGWRQLPLAPAHGAKGLHYLFA